MNHGSRNQTRSHTGAPTDCLRVEPVEVTRRSFVGQTLLALSGAPLVRASAFEPVASDRMQWWRDARFGMFVHFGLYSGPGGMWNGQLTGSHEWMRNNAKVPHEEYIRLADSFNPYALDPDAIVRLARDAGQKYVVITTKHHEGFSLFDSAVSSYDVMSTPYRRDIMRQFADACREHGLKLGWYYSIMDWYHPDYLPKRDWEAAPPSGADFSRYVRFMHAQLRELLTNYGDVAVLWFDGQWESTWNAAHGRATYDLCRTLQPNVLINNRVDVKRDGGTDRLLGQGQAGDFSTPELEIPATGIPGQDWESCMTMNDNWGYAADDQNYKSVPTLIGILVETASKGGNLLLNVGPDGLGRVPQGSTDGLRGVGAWMRYHSDAIHASRASLISSPDCRTTTQQRTINVFVDRWRSGPLLLRGVRTAPVEAWSLGERPTRVSVGQGPDGVTLQLPDRPFDPICSVIRIRFAGEPEVGP